ncbi:MAG TPA: DUF2905 domain-containing protein [bacterium]|nr:DUF2905 domain-containing protein [bacterium]HOL48197.1 DUF2905 domain-containing protein [bacterium]HPQ19602.1 DUF2905 domain-containing protein [bacterium]
MMKQIGAFLFLTGLIICIVGILLFFSDKIKFIGKLPGDILIKKDNFTFYFPITTSILLSIIISILLYFFRK